MNKPAQKPNPAAALLFAAMTWAFSVHGQPTPVYVSGSDGSDGALEVTTDTTITLPPDGVLNYTTVSIASGATLTFARNARNTPVYLLATGDILIDGNIDVSGTHGTQTQPGRGGPGGWDGGVPGLSDSPAGEGSGPGGGKVGTRGNRFGRSPDWDDNRRFVSGGAAYASRPTTLSGADHQGSVYGSSLLLPLLGGSGGAGAHWQDSETFGGGGGGGGGGAILIASSSRITFVSGNLDSEGGRGGERIRYLLANGASRTGTYAQGGSGGAIRLVAPVVSGTGMIRAGSETSDGGGWGRVRIDTAQYGPQRPDIEGAAVSVGFNPIIFPPNPPELRIARVADTVIPEVSSGSIIVSLPADGNPVQPVAIEARNFNSQVVFILKLQPERGPSIELEATIDNLVENPASVTLQPTFPLDQTSQLFVWTKQTVRFDPSAP